MAGEHGGHLSGCQGLTGECAWGWMSGMPSPSPTPRPPKMHPPGTRPRPGCPRARMQPRLLPGHDLEPLECEGCCPAPTQQVLEDSGPWTPRCCPWPTWGTVGNAPPLQCDAENRWCVLWETRAHPGGSWGPHAPCMNSHTCIHDLMFAHVSTEMHGLTHMCPYTQHSHPIL